MNTKHIFHPNNSRVSPRFAISSYVDPVLVCLRPLR